MPFPKKFAAKDDPNAASAAPAAPTFSKKFGKRKTRKAAPAQKSLLASGRSLAGGGR